MASEDRRTDIVLAAAQYLEERLLNVKLELRESMRLTLECQNKLKLEGERIACQAEMIQKQDEAIAELQAELNELAEVTDASGG